MRFAPAVTIALAGAGFLLGSSLRGQTTFQSTADFTKYAEKLRESALRNMEPQIVVPTTSRFNVDGRYPWKTGIVTTLFWIGGAGKAKTGASAWDPKWEAHYGGFDNPNPDNRHQFIPAGFVPRLNPFYVALPYNDVAHGATKPEAKIVIPWFHELTDHGGWQDGQSICRDRWLAIRNSGGKVCYAQWSDSGPFHADHWQYVFGNEKPRPNANGGAGLNVSPAVRDYLELGSTDVTDWKFVDGKDVPNGPWALYGENNPLTQKNRASAPVADGPPARTEPPAVLKAPPPEGNR